MRSIQRHGRYCVYILQCADGTYYTGSTNDLAKRLKRHQNGHGAKYLRGKVPVRVAYKKEYRYFKHALRAERALKALTHREKAEIVRTWVENISAV